MSDADERQLPHDDYPRIPTRRAPTNRMPILVGAAMLVVIAIALSLASLLATDPRPAAGQGADTVSVRASHLLPPPPVVERYLKAQADFDAKGMLDSISDELKGSALGDAESTVLALQAELDAARESGRRYVGATYVGGIPTRGGQQVYFYVLSVDGPDGAMEVPYIYVLGPGGKIVSIQ